MKDINKQLVAFTIIIITICFVSVFIFTLPTFIEQLDLTTKSNIGSSIGGITAPVIGVISSILLYLALTKQTQSNIDQRLKNESDVIFLLLNQLHNETANFYYKYSVNKKEEKRYTGIEGLNDFCRKYRHEYNLTQFENKDSSTFKIWYESGQVVLLVESYNLIENRIEKAELSEDMKSLFLEKLKIYYECILKTPLSDLHYAFEKYPHQKDEYTSKIQELVERNSD
ncbi:MAG: hypothetical protein AAF944_24810 [Bacteroidota bacterium]